MASSSRVFGRTCRALMAAAKSPTGTPTAAAAKGPAGTPTAAAAAAATPTATSAAKTKTKAKKPLAPKKPVGILKSQPISPVLEEFLGTSEASRTDAVKKVWDYAKLNNLQNPANKKEIFCDATLKTIFDGKDQVGFTEVARLLKQHFVKT